MQINPFVLLTMCALITGCSSQYNITPNNYYSPRNETLFKLKNQFYLRDTSVLSTSALYKQNTYGDEVWFKFFEDGRLFYGSLSKIPKSSKDLVNGYVGYYTLNSGKIKAEIFYLQQWKWECVILEGNIKGDTIRFYKDHYKDAKRNIKHFTSYPGFERYFIKKYDSIYLMPPDW